MATSPPLGAISSGIRYEVRFFWRHALQMLLPSHPVVRVVLEHRDVEPVDDVVVYYASPGRNDHGDKVTVDFHQIKYHVAHSGAVTHAAVVNPGWAGTKLSILRRFADAWRPIAAEHSNARLLFVTNWPWHPDCPLAPLLRDGGRMDDRFHTASPSSEVGQIYRTWRETSGLPDAEFASFLRSVRFTTGASSMDQTEMMFNYQCHAAGLRPPTHGADHSPYDDLGYRFIESGRTEHTPESLRELLKKEGLVAGPDQPFRSTFAVCSFPRYAFPADAAGACVVDLTDSFEGRTPTDPDVWGRAVRERLEGALPTVAKLGQPVQLALDAHLSIAWYVGYLLDAKSGIPVRLRQHVKGKGVELWDVSTAARPVGAPDWEILAETVGAGPDLAVVVSVTHAALADAARTIADDLPDVGTVLHASLPTAGPHAIVDGSHAAWLANSLTAALAKRSAELRPQRLHLFLACPASLGFLLGQEGKCLGPTTVYEFDFGSPSRAYRPGMST